MTIQQMTDDCDSLLRFDFLHYWLMRGQKQKGQNLQATLFFLFFFFKSIFRPSKYPHLNDTRIRRSRNKASGHMALQERALLVCRNFHQKQTSRYFLEITWTTKRVSLSVQLSFSDTVQLSSLICPITLHFIENDVIIKWLLIHLNPVI